MRTRIAFVIGTGLLAACSLLGGPADSLGGTLHPAFVYHFNGDHRDDLADADADGAGGAYLLATTISEAALVRIDASGKERWRAKLAFDASALAPAAGGVYVVGDKRDSSAGGQRAYAAFVEENGRVRWTIETSSAEAASAAPRDSVWDLSAPGDAELWEAAALPSGDAVALGVGPGATVRFLRIDTAGRIVWEQAAPAAYNWMYTGGSVGKIRPYLAAAAGSILAAGAWNAEGASAGLAVYRLEAETGALQAQFTAAPSGASFAGADWNEAAGLLAVAWNSKTSGSGLIVLDSALQPVAQEAVDFHANSGVAWAGGNSVWIAGWKKGGSAFVNRVAAVRIDAAGNGSPQESVWEDARVVDQVKLAAFGGECVLAAAENLSARDDQVDNSRIVLRKCALNSEPLFTFQRGEVYQGDPQLQAFAGGLLLAVHHGSDGPILILFRDG
jgi:hypothetical protein